MSTKYIASNWRLLNEENSGKSDNYGLSFNGSESIKTSAISITSSSSFSFWFKKTANSAQSYGGTLLSSPYVFNASYNNTWALAINNSNQLTLESYNGTSGSYTNPIDATTIANNTWNNLIGVLTYTDSSNSSIQFYLNGSSFGSAISLSGRTLAGVSNGLIIGGYDFTGDGNADRYFLNGSISEVAVFDYPLSATQISTLYGSSELGSTSPMALKPQPVGYWPLGDNSSGNPLTQPNEAVEDASVFDFDGSSNYIDLNFQSLTTPATISIWVNTDVNDSQQRYAIINGRADQSPTLYLRMQSDNTYQVFLSNTNGSDTLQGSSATINTWFHFVIVCEDSQTLLYENGVLKDSSTIGWSGINIDQSNNWELGRDSRGMRFWKGQLSNTQIWQAELSASEVTTLYNSGVPLLTGTQPQESNLKAWYKLDQSANWEADSTGAWQIPDAVSAYAQSFDISGTSYIKVNRSTSIEPAKNLTVSVWVNWKTGSNFYSYAINKDYDASHGSYAITRVNQPRFFIFTSTGIVNSPIASSVNLTDTGWHHLVGTYDGSYVRFYVDGEEIGSGTAETGDIIYNTGDLIIGTFQSSVNLSPNGEQSNLQIWNTALPATGTDSVETLYNNGTPLTTAIASDNLKLWAKLDNTATFSTNWSVPDASGNGNTGTSSGMTEQNLVNNNVSALNGESSGMTSANLVLSDLTRAVPYDSYSFNFDAASSDKIDCGDIGFYTPEISFSCWIYPTNNGQFIQYGTDPNNPALWCFVHNNTQLRIYVRNAYRFFFSCITLNQWHHIVITRTNYNDGKVYVNGVSQGDLIGTAADKTQTGNLIIGTSFNGKINNFAVFNEALTSTEVLKLYSNGVPQDLANFTPAPIAWWPLGSNSFWNGSQWTVRDMIGSNDGTGQNIGIDGLVGDSPRSSANGTGTNMDIPTNLEGQTKYSSNNSWSINMSESARVEETP